MIRAIGLDIDRSAWNECPASMNHPLVDHEFSRIAIWSEQ
jgi:hypothetical protein